MTLPFAILAALVLGGALASVTVRSRVHAGLCLALSLIGLALVFLRLNAEFIGFIQILVYVGAVAVLIVFAILLTRGTESPRDRLSNSPATGMLVSGTIFGLLLWAIAIGRPAAPKNSPSAEIAVTVHAIGDHLLREYVLPLQAIGLLLTAALIGAAVIALPVRSEPTGPESPQSPGSSKAEP